MKTLACFCTALLQSVFSAHAQISAPSSGAQDTGLSSKLQCSPVTPETKVPWIEVSQLPDLTQDHAYFEWCSDLDYAWTTQSYPNPKYVPNRTLEHEARVALLVQGLKDYVAAESDDWGAYVNAWLGTTLPPSKVESRRYPGGDSSIRSSSDARDHTLAKLGSRADIGIYSHYYVSPQGAISNDKRLSISGLSSDADCRLFAEGSPPYMDHCKIGMATEKLCLTPVDLQRAFENQPGYLFRPASVRSARTRPNRQALAKLGGQWSGYEVHVLANTHTGQYMGSMRFGFGFKPCASRIFIELNKNHPQGDKP